MTGFLSSGCRGDRDAIAQALPARIAAERRSQELQEALRKLYNPPSPLWTGSRGARDQAGRAVALLAGAEPLGLRPEDYGATGLLQRLQALGRGATPEAQAAFEVDLSAEMLRFLRAVHRGRVNPQRVGFEYHKDVDAEDLAAPLRRAVETSQLEALPAQLEPRYAPYRRVKAALAEYRERARAGRGSPAQVRKLELALERLRWLPHQTEGRFVVVNVPAFRLLAYGSSADERPQLQMAVVVGKASENETPLFSEEMRTVVFRPPWFPPPSIVQNEIVPAMESDPRYLDRQRMQLVALDSGDDSPSLPATSENLALLEAGQLSLRQEPGPQSALGLVKFDFPNRHNVYLHDTPSQSLFNRARRDFSHGCIRVEDPLALAEWVLAGQGDWTRAKIETAMHAADTKRVEVAHPLPVMIFYSTALPGADGQVQFFDDIYGLDADLEAALAHSGRGGWDSRKASASSAPSTTATMSAQGAPADKWARSAPTGVSRP
ncbi:MAG TPA: L,D-transpeptidase family protein [Vicinamibacteria bacterium]